MNCRHCGNKLKHDLINLGSCPPSNAYVTKNKLKETHPRFPLRVKICEICYLVQTEDFTKSEALFDSKYAYLSSVSKTWQKHCKEFANKIIKSRSLDSNSLVLEIASNDGCLLENFTKKKIKSIGIEPTNLAARISKNKGINTITEFFDVNLANKIVKRYGKADLVCANNVFAHVPKINNFVRGLKIILSKDGLITIEFPHLLNLIKNNLFDTIYHEHFSYLSLTTTCNILLKYGLKVYDIEKIDTHGGSLRVYICHEEKNINISKRVNNFRQKEKDFGLFKMITYRKFQKNVNIIQQDLISFLNGMIKNNKKVAAYGAAAKGNTLLNSIGVTRREIKFVCDNALSKQGKFMPGSLIPIVDKKKLFIEKPDIVLILPWNLTNEVKKILEKTKKWNCKLFVALPKLKEVK